MYVHRHIIIVTIGLCPLQICPADEFYQVKRIRIRLEHCSFIFTNVCKKILMVNSRKYVHVKCLFKSKKKSKVVLDIYD